MIDTGTQLVFHYRLQSLFTHMINDFKTFADMIIGLAMLISLIVAVNHVMHDAKYGKGKQAIISWLIAFGVWVIARSVF